MHFLLFALLLTACQSGVPQETAASQPALAASPAPAPAASATVSFGDRQIAVGVAATPESRRQGLSGRASLAEDTGLVLLWPRPTFAPIWMPNMKFAIDVVFVRDNRVVAIYADRQPCPSLDDCPTFGPSIPVHYVLEVPAGSCARWGLKEGMDIRLTGAQTALDDGPEDYSSY